VLGLGPAAADWPTAKQTVALAPTVAPSKAPFAYAKAYDDDAELSGAVAVAATHAPHGAPESAAGSCAEID
jgi:hypothetical protein